MPGFNERTEMSRVPIPLPSFDYLFSPLSITAIMNCGNNQLGKRHGYRIEPQYLLTSSQPEISIHFFKFWWRVEAVGDFRT